MNNLRSNDLDVIVNVQYGIGFELVEGRVEIEIKFLNETQKSRTVSANQNRIDFNEGFVWNVDRALLKDHRSANGFVKIECFTAPTVVFGNICQRQRIGRAVIKLKEFQVIGRDWDQCVAERSYDLRGCRGRYQLLVILVIQGHVENLECSRKISKNPMFNNDKNNSFKVVNQPLRFDKTGDY